MIWAIVITVMGLPTIVLVAWAMRLCFRRPDGEVARRRRTESNVRSRPRLSPAGVGIAGSGNEQAGTKPPAVVSRTNVSLRSPPLL